ncbi:saccharopine dehydrogenase family protein [Candidatus Neomarinimicrobiota bacterium]
MDNKAILILGGYGSAGLHIAKLLLENTDVRLTLAGRSQSKAIKVSAELNTQYDGIRVAGIQVDASKEEVLKRALVGIDLLVVASSTAQYAHQVASAALAAGVDYLDIQYSTDKLRALQAIATTIEEQERCFITDGGFHPGLPAALVRYAGKKVRDLERAVVGAVLKVDWGAYSVGDSATEEFVSEFKNYQPLVYRNGEWRKANMWRIRDFLRMNYGEPFGKAYAAPMMLEEMRALPEMLPSLKETGFYVAGFNWFADWFLFPMSIAAARLGPGAITRRAGRTLFWGLNRFARPPYGIVLQMKATGMKEDTARQMKLRISHEDGYFLTAAPTVACIMQYLEGKAAAPGLHFMAHIMEPEQMLRDIEKMGVKVTVEYE